MAAIQKLSELIATLDAGSIDAAASMDLAHLVELVQQSGKSGALTLTLKVEREGLNGHACRVLAVHKVKEPSPPPAGSSLFIGDNGSLHRTDPYQQSLPTQKADKS